MADSSNAVTAPTAIARPWVRIEDLAALAAAAALHGAAVWARSMGWIPRSDLVLGGIDALLPAVILATAGLVLFSGRRELAVVAGICVLPFAVRPGVLALLILATGGVWGVSLLPLRALPRLALSAAVLTMLVGLRCGWAGARVAGVLKLQIGVELSLWGLLFFRSWLFQMERDALEPRLRSYPAFLGSVGLFALGGAVIGPPIPHATLYADRAAPQRISLAWRAVGLLALALAYQVAVKQLIPGLQAPFHAFRASGARGGLQGQLAAFTPGRVWLALALYWPLKYVLIGSRLFFLIANLRLLGFDLPSGFRQPFLARNFIDLWRRWNHYVRDAAMVMFYFPSLGALRRRLPPALAQPAAILASFTALVVVDTLARPAFELPIVVNRGSMLVQAVRLVLIGVLTAATAWWALRTPRSRSAAGGWVRAATILTTISAAAAISTVAGVLATGLTGAQLSELAGFLFGVS